MRLTRLIFAALLAWPSVGAGEEDPRPHVGDAGSPRHFSQVNEILDLRRRMGVELSPWSELRPTPSAFANEVQELASGVSQAGGYPFNQSGVGQANANGFPTSHGQFPLNAKPRPAPSPGAGDPVRRLFEGAFRLESIAHELDVAGVSKSTEAIRRVAATLRAEARELREQSPAPTAADQPLGEDRSSLPDGPGAGAHHPGMPRAYRAFATPPPSTPRFPGTGLRSRSPASDQPRLEPQNRNSHNEPTGQPTGDAS